MRQAAVAAQTKVVLGMKRRVVIYGQYEFLSMEAVMEVLTILMFRCVGASIVPVVAAAAWLVAFEWREPCL